MMKVGAVMAQLVHCLRDLFFRLDVERTRRLVEHEDRRIMSDRAGNAQTLAFAAGKLRATLTDKRCRSPRFWRG